MKKSIKIIAAAFMVLITMSSCDNDPSLQQYYVDNTENADFLSLDIPVSTLGVDTGKFSATEKEAYESVRKLNVLAFKLNGSNKMEYGIEQEKVNAILKNPNYNELMRMGSGGKGAVVKYLGDDDSIDEVVIFGKDDEMGFALVRVLGDNMNPANMVQLMKAMENADFNGNGQLKELENFLKKS